MHQILDVFQPGLHRGEEHLPFDPTKGYFFVEHPTEKWRVYLRAACFVHEEGAIYDPKRFLVVKTTGKDTRSKVWEPPKGQMEGKDALKHPRTLVSKLILENVRREVEEEAHINKLKHLSFTGLIYQNTEPNYPKDKKWFFQYHIFRAVAPIPTIQRALNWFSWLEEHPKYFAKMKRDKKEKDALRWFDVSETRLLGKWSPSIVAMYIQHFTQSK
jgi:hypothetical protein